MDPAFKSGNVAVVTGAALGIGRSAATRFAEIGMRVVLIDLSSGDFDETATRLKDTFGDSNILKAELSVTDVEGLNDLASDVAQVFAVPSVVMNNAASRVGGDCFADKADWRKTFEVNLWGVVNGTDAFATMMIEAGGPRRVINVCSKQGITNPPRNPAYNMTKSAVKIYTEVLQHELRNRNGCEVSAHLLVPGWTTTGKQEHKPGAWMPEQVVDYMLSKIERGSFYIICSDNEVSEVEDAKRIIWGAMDMTEDRPPLSRWHNEYYGEFDVFEP
jgi:NAD(P)-dependent dehydrogenase (short-subunit alcohol dehydrogenase family)